MAAAADRWSEPAGRGIAQRAAMRVAAERHAAVSLTSIGVRALLGGGAALLSLLVVAGVASRQTTVVGASALAVVWTALYSAVFLAAEHPSVRGLMRAALTSSGVALAIVPAVTVHDIVRACERWLGVSHHAHHSPDSIALSILVVAGAVGYTAAPLLAGGVAARVVSSRDWVVDGLKLSVLYALLTAPAVAIQCLVLPVQVMALWPTGALLGAAAAGPIGLWLGGRLRRSMAR